MMVWENIFAIQINVKLYITDINMEVERIPTELKFVNRIGQTLSVEEIISVQSSVLKLSHEYKF